MTDITVATEFIGYLVGGFVVAMQVALGGVLLRAVADFFKGSIR